MRRFALPIALTLTALAAAAPAQAASKKIVLRVATSPGQVVSERTDAGAAKLVHSAPELRGDNATANQTRLTAAQLKDFRARDTSLPAFYKNRIDGAYTGTTDEIIQWAAIKWGLSPELLRSVASVETWWHMSFVGDNGSSFGLFQIREPYHCCQQYAQSSTAFNADYYAATIRSYYDGTQTWLNTVSGNGAHYSAGDLWDSVGYWASGRWHDAGAAAYVAKVDADLASRPWTGQWF